MELNKEQKRFFKKSVESCTGLGNRSSFTFIVKTILQLEVALKALYKSGYKWIYDNDINEIEGWVKKHIKNGETVRIRVEFEGEDRTIKMLYASFRRRVNCEYDLEFEETMKFLAYLRKGYKEIERRSYNVK